MKSFQNGYFYTTREEENLTLNFDSKTGKTKKNKFKALLERLSLHKDEVLKFINDFDIPFELSE